MFLSYTLAQMPWIPVPDTKACCLLLIAGLLGGCERPAIISGQVIDNFGEPVEGVSVRVAETGPATSTAMDGRFVLERNAGEITLDFSKPGYTATSVSLIAEEGTCYPLDAISTVRIPPEEGTYLQGARDYIPLAPATVISTRGGLLLAEQISFEAEFDDAGEAQLSAVRDALSALSGDAIFVLQTDPRSRFPVAVDLESGAIGQVFSSMMTGFLPLHYIRTIDETLTEMPEVMVRRVEMAPNAIAAGEAYCFVEAATGLDFGLTPPEGESDAFCF